MLSWAHLCLNDPNSLTYQTTKTKAHSIWNSVEFDARTKLTGPLIHSIEICNEPALEHHTISNGPVLQCVTLSHTDATGIYTCALLISGTLNEPHFIQSITHSTLYQKSIYFFLKLLDKHIYVNLRENFVLTTPPTQMWIHFAKWSQRYD